jgi:hypothetical protein
MLIVLGLSGKFTYFLLTTGCKNTQFNNLT